LKGNISLGEAWPTARVRILAPKHMVFDNTSLVTNYTSGSIDIFFPVGILFVDIISLNFSMFIDPNSIIPKEKGYVSSTLVMFPICQQTQFFQYPVNPITDYIACGGMASTSFGVNVSGEI